MLTVSVPPGTGSGTYFVDVTGTIGGTSHTTRVAIVVDTDRPHDRPAVAGDQLVRVVQRRPVPRRGRLADGQGLDDDDRRLPGPLERRRRRVEQQGRRRIRIEIERAQLRGGAHLPRAGAGARRGRQLERLEPGGPVRRRGRAGRQLDADQERAPGACRTRARGRVARPATRRRPARRSAARSPARGSRWSPRGARSGAPRRVYIDGSLATTIHLGARHLHPRRIVFTRTWKSTMTHSIQVVVVGSPHHRRVDVDAFVILR